MASDCELCGKLMLYHTPIRDVDNKTFGWICPGMTAEVRRIFTEKVVVEPDVKLAPAVELVPDQALRERCLQIAMEFSGTSLSTNRTARQITQSAMEIEQYLRTGT